MTTAIRLEDLKPSRAIDRVTPRECTARPTAQSGSERTPPIIGLDRPDVRVDLAAELTDGTLATVQCKCYEIDVVAATDDSSQRRVRSRCSTSPKAVRSAACRCPQ